MPPTKVKPSLRMHVTSDGPDHLRKFPEADSDDRGIQLQTPIRPPSQPKELHTKRVLVCISCSSQGPAMRQKGFYFDVGAFHGLHCSNTAKLDIESAWSGGGGVEPDMVGEPLQSITLRYLLGCMGGG